MAKSKQTRREREMIDDRDDRDDEQEGSRR